MRSAAEMIEVLCPRCGEEFADWFRPAESSPLLSTCPHCGHDLTTDPVVHEDGVLALTPVEDEGFEA